MGAPIFVRVLVCGLTVSGMPPGQRSFAADRVESADGGDFRLAGTDNALAIASKCRNIPKARHIAGRLLETLGSR